MSGNKSDRKFDTWEWSDRTVAPQKLTFEVRMERPNNVAEGSIRYYVRSEDPPVRVEASDLGPLRDKLDAAVRAFYAVAWERVLVVRVEQRLPGEDGASAKLEVVATERGMMGDVPVFRQAATRSDNHGNYVYAVQRGPIPPVIKSFGRDDVPQYVLPDTPEVRAWLAEESKRLSAWATDLVAKVKEIGAVGTAPKEISDGV